MTRNITYPTFTSSSTTSSPSTMSPYRPNPFFSTTSTFFLPSVGDKVDQAIQSTQQYGKDAQAKGNELYNKADVKFQDAKEAVKDVANPNAPTGIDLYSRFVDRDCYHLELVIVTTMEASKAR